ncbi:MAG: DUF1501 domain-containing protein, partial [Verrucomicrobiota bacterium]|nr:DUF1501 domain-containing protein [Verrucomicrobiota bacterium]
EMAFRMQAAAPEVVDLSNEPPGTFELYGPDSKVPGSYAYNCLLARRMAQRGVRFIQLFHRGWDQHRSLQTHLRNQCRDTDQASAALVADLKQRGLLEDTLVIWGGEFGRMPFSEGKGAPGRNHNPYGFCMWMAGGGVKGGMSYGETDEFGFEAVVNKTHVHDIHATILHLMGIDHEDLSYFHQGRQETLTDVHGRVITEICA